MIVSAVNSLAHLRDYQREALTRTLAAFETHRSALVVMPTGVGKTVLFDAVIAARLETHGGRALVVAHRDELIQQAKAKIEHFSGLECDVEMGDSWADQCAMHRRAPVLVTSVQTMSRRKRRARFHPEDFSLVVIDEAHHAPAATYRAVVDHFAANQDVRVLGVTATPDRGDQRALGLVFETVAYEYKIVSAIDDGYLVPIRQQFVRCEGLDLSGLATGKNGDFKERQLCEILEEEKQCHQIAAPTIELAGDKRTLVFAASVAQAETIAEIINRHRPHAASWVCGDEARCPRDTRRDILAKFAAGEVQFLVNCAVLLEGFDDPGIEIVAVARPTKSRALYCQIVGRGTRPLGGTVDGLETATERTAAIAASGKPFVTVLDFVGNAGRHKLVHTGDLLGGDFTEDVRAEAGRAVKAASKRGERLDMLAALRAAEEKRQEQRRRERERVRVQAQYTARTVDPFDRRDRLPERQQVNQRGARMPFGKHKGKLVATLSDWTLNWYAENVRQGWVREAVRAELTRRGKLREAATRPAPRPAPVNIYKQQAAECEF